MVYITGDIHGDPSRVIDFAKDMNLTKKDTIIILGDVGANYYNGKRDSLMKRFLNAIEPTVLCIHGNHEIRPGNIASYHTEKWRDGEVWIEDEFPNIKFAKDGEIFTIEDIRYIVIGGAYSVDKYYRLAKGYGWWDDEQPSEEIKKFVEKQLQEHKIDVVLTHTCPMKYEPVEMFLSQIDQTTVDKSTEEWLDKIENLLDYKAWFCGHWHTDKRIDKMHFLFKGWETAEFIF